MADFAPAFELMIRHEGGFKLHTVAGDRGGKTYAGIAFNYHPEWAGWKLLESDPENPELTRMVRDFYKANYWDKVKGDQISDQKIAESLFDFAVNAGVRTAAVLAQLVAGVTPDGIIGNQSVAAINQQQAAVFIPNFALAKIARYARIVSKDASQGKFLLGWINRTLEGLV